MSGVDDFNDIDDSTFQDSSLEGWIGSLDNSYDLPQGVKSTKAHSVQFEDKTDPLSMDCMPWLYLYKNCLINNHNKHEACEKQFSDMDDCTSNL